MSPYLILIHTHTQAQTQLRQVFTWKVSLSFYAFDFKSNRYNVFITHVKEYKDGGGGGHVFCFLNK